MQTDLTTELQKIYDSEINIRIGWFWDGGIDVALGDEVGGFVAAENVPSVADIVPWLQEAIAHFYPTSTYPNSLSDDLRPRAKNRLFLRPQTSAQVLCPACGAPNAVPPGMNEVIAFVCRHCGEGVAVGSPAVN